MRIDSNKTGILRCYPNAGHSSRYGTSVQTDLNHIFLHFYRNESEDHVPYRGSLFSFDNFSVVVDRISFFSAPIDSVRTRHSFNLFLRF